MSARRKGLTLIELLVIFAICGILLALLIPAIQAARKAAQDRQQANAAPQNPGKNFAYVPEQPQGGGDTDLVALTNRLAKVVERQQEEINQLRSEVEKLRSEVRKTAP